MLILLDIDGVMVPAKSWKPVNNLADGFPDFSLKAVNSLKKLISETQASIVITSTHKSRFTIAQWENIFKRRGINASIDLLDDNRDLNRKDEIVNWYDTHADLDFIIIDDDKRLNGLPKNIKHRLVSTSSSIGLNEESYNIAKEIIEHSQPA